MSKEASNYLEAVRNQYEDLPYPPRDPQDEYKHLMGSETDFLDHLNHYGFGGKESFTNGFRILIAGGGTGDATIFLAEQLRHTNAQIVHMDISTASLALAKERAKIRKLSNVTFIHESLLNLADMELEPFDYINCYGVLHHLSDPDAGLAALCSKLKPEGVLAIMLYGQIGRTGVYHMQEIMQRLNTDTQDINTQLKRCRKVLEVLPATNWFRLGEAGVTDHKTFGDSGIYDLLLHPQDRAYTIPEVYDYADRQQLNIRHFIAANGKSKLRADHHVFVRDKEICARLDSMPERDRLAFMELFMGNMIKHTFYASRQKATLPSIDDEEMVPYYSMLFYKDDVYERISDAAAQLFPIKEEVTFENRGMKVKLKRMPYITELIQAMDGNRTIHEIYQDVTEKCEGRGEATPNREQLKATFAHFYTVFHYLDWIFLRHSSVPAPKQVEALQSTFLVREKGKAIGPSKTKKSSRGKNNRKKKRA